MLSTFRSSAWQISFPNPWGAQAFEESVEITRPGGIGAIHVSCALKENGAVSDSETRAELQRNCPDDTDAEIARFGDFAGHGAEYIDWNESVFWRKWFVASGCVFLFITYNCKRGDEDLELAQVCQILSSLKLRR